MKRARLLLASVYAAELGRSVEWTAANFRVRAREKATPAGKGRCVGELPPGSEVEVLSEHPEDYYVRAGVVEGFINRMHFQPEGG